ncbi:hypothetical protein INR49_015220 [Caranx melampygus]|nr:hypothetical protein INR49_015220 [Caranx melampygus]
MNPVVHQTKRLSHVVCRSHCVAGVTSRLLQEAEGIVRLHHIPADSPQTPAGETVSHLNNNLQTAVSQQLACQRISSSEYIDAVSFKSRSDVWLVTEAVDDVYHKKEATCGTKTSVEQLGTSEQFLRPSRYKE